MSRVIVRVAAVVAFFTTLSLADLRVFVSLPVTLLVMKAPTMAARVDVMAVTMALSTFFIMPGFFFFSFSAFASSFSAALASSSFCFCSAAS